MCTGTSLRERRLLSQAIKRAIASTLPTEPVGQRLQAISNELFKLASGRSLFFKGPLQPFASPGRDLLHSKSNEWFKQGIQRRLATLFDLDTANSLTNEIRAELQNPGPWPTLHSNRVLSLIPLHDHGSPFWVADPASGTPPAESALPFYPARTGLDPRRDEYVLIYVECTSGHAPRFADSRGNPNWRPGGRTKPIDGCPSGMSGFGEAVVDGVNLGSLSRPIVVFDRDL